MSVKKLQKPTFQLPKLNLNLNLKDVGLKKMSEKDINKEVKEEIGEKLKAIKESEAKYKKQIEIETSANFYFQVVFESPDQLKEFLKEKKITLEYGDFAFYDKIKDRFK